MENRELEIMIIENRIQNLKNRNAVVNANIIHRLERKLKRLKGENDHI